MITLTAPTPTETEAGWLRRTHLGIALAVVGLVAMGVGMILTRHDSQPEGYSFHGLRDYVLTAAALPQGVGLVFATLGVHRLQHGADGRLGTLGLWIYGLCMTELIIQCMVGVFAGSETVWGPAYPVCAFGLMLGLVLLAAGSWSVGLVPRWMLALWPPLGLVGSFLGVGPIPFVFAAFLVLLGVLLQRRVGRSAAE